MEKLDQKTRKGSKYKAAFPHISGIGSASDDTTFLVLEPGAKVGRFKLAPGGLHTVRVRFVPTQKYPLGVRVFTLDLVQKAKDRVIGGQRFVLKSLPDPRYVAIDKPSSVFDGVTWVSIRAGTAVCPC